MPFLLRDVFTWVDEAYPDGVPPEDSGTLVGLLRHRIGAEQTLDLVLRLAAAGHLDASVAGRTGSTDDLDPAAVRRVSGRLAAGGWPLAGPQSTSTATDDDTPPDPQSTLGGSWRGCGRDTPAAFPTTTTSPCSPCSSAD